VNVPDSEFGFSELWTNRSIGSRPSIDLLESRLSKEMERFYGKRSA